ncbi:MAG: hypothetical protein OXH13_05940 [Chloroflexi bacterium]|nr:hypothetical protein [Chloroflexota bacterium]MCY3696351.1 hypothetical protein [Chloroflexota bacterium]
MPPRVRLTPDEAARLPRLLARVDGLRSAFPVHTGASGQAAWIREQYTDGQPPSLNLITLLLFEHGVHRSTEQVAQDLAMLREES